MTQPQVLSEETYVQMAEEFYELSLKLFTNWEGHNSGRKVTKRFILDLTGSPRDGYLLIDEKMREGVIKAVRRQGRLIPGAKEQKVFDIARETCQVLTDFEKLAKLWQDLVENGRTSRVAAGRQLQDSLRHHLI